MTKEEETGRLNKVGIIINTLGLAGLSDEQDLWLKDYLDGKHGYCETVIDFLVMQAHEIKNPNSQNKIQ
jgi:hypothetical protein